MGGLLGLVAPVMLHANTHACKRCVHAMQAAVFGKGRHLPTPTQKLCNNLSIQFLLWLIAFCTYTAAITIAIIWLQTRQLLSSTKTKLILNLARTMIVASQSSHMIDVQFILLIKTVACGMHLLARCPPYSKHRLPYP
jgi:hypothetical protein